MTPEHGDDGTRLVDMPHGEEWRVCACLCGAKFVEDAELREHIAEETSDLQASIEAAEQGGGVSRDGLRHEHTAAAPESVHQR